MNESKQEQMALNIESATQPNLSKSVQEQEICSITRYKGDEVFDILKKDGKYYIGLAGKLVESKPYRTKRSARRQIKKRSYSVLIALIMRCMEINNFKK